MNMKNLLLVFLGVLLLANFGFALKVLTVNGSGTGPNDNCTQATDYGAISALAGNDRQPNHRTIGSAITNATAGDIIVVCRNASSAATYGIYNENVIINKSVNITGNESGIIVNATNPGSPVFLINQTNFVNMTNFTLTNASLSYGIQFNGTSSYNTIYGVSLIRNIFGIFMTENTEIGNTFSNMSINDSSDDAITAQGNSNTHSNINISSSSDTTGDGAIYVNGDHNAFYNITFFAAAVNGFGVHPNADNTTIRNNTITNVTGAGIYSRGTNTTIMNNTVFNNSVGINVLGNFSNITNNTVYNNTVAGISVSGPAAVSNIVSGNAVYFHQRYTSNSASGILVNYTNALNHIINNILIYNNTYGIYLNRANYTNVSVNFIYNSTGNDGYSGYNGRGVFLYFSNNNTIQDVNITQSYRDGLYLLSSSNNNITLVRTYNQVVGSGVYIDTSSSNLFNMTASYSNDDEGFSLTASTASSSNSNTFVNSTAYLNTLNGFKVYANSGTSVNSTIFNSSFYNNSNAGISIIGASASGVSFNVLNQSFVFNNTLYGVYTEVQSNGGTFENSSVYNNSYGIYLNRTNNTIIRNMSIYNNTNDNGQLYFYWSSFNNLSSSTILGNDTLDYGISMHDASVGNRFTNVNVSRFDVAGYNVNVSGVISAANVEILNVGTLFSLGTAFSRLTNGGNGGFVNLSNLTIYNVKNGINATSSANYVALLSNVLYNCSSTDGACVNLNYGSAESNSVLLGNNISNTSGNAFRLSLQGSSFANNVIDNATIALNITAYNLTFSGNNIINNTPAAGYEIYITGGANLSTSTYNITTANMSFGLNRTSNVWIRSVNLSVAGLGINDTNHGISIPGGTPDGLAVGAAGIIRMYNNNWAGLNVTNTTGDGATVSPIFYYNSTDAANYSYTVVGSRISSNAWSAFSSTGTGGGISAIGSYGYFAVIGYNLSLSQAATGSSGTSSSKSLPTLSKTFTCEDGKLEVSAGISGLGLTLYNTKDFSYVSKTADSNGKAVFTITKDGNYEVDSVASSLYLSNSIGPFKLELCGAAVTSPTAQPEEWVAPSEEVTGETEQPTEELPPVVEPGVSVTKEEALAAISAADSAITTATKAGKDVADAKKKLDAAGAELAKGNYAEALNLANTATDLAKNAKPKPAAPAAPAVTTPAAAQPQKGFDMGTILLVVVVIAVVLVGLYLFNKGKGASKGFKGQSKGQKRI